MRKEMNLQMETLIELFDESPVLNILACVAFKPKKLIFFGANPNEIEQNKNDYIRFFKRRKEKVDIEFITVNMLNLREVETGLEKIIKDNPDCVLDVTGGKDLALLAAGMAAVRLGVPLVFYNKKTEKYVNMNKYCCEMDVDIYGLLNCQDFFCVSGGSITDFEDFSEYNDTRREFWQLVLNIWDIYLKHMGSWPSHVQYLQKATHNFSQGSDSRIKCPAILNSNGHKFYRNDDIINDLRSCGAFKDFEKCENNDFYFTYKDSNFKRYLTDVGAFLELYIHVCALQTRCFSDVLSRVKYNWDWEYANYSKQLHNTLFRPASNEIDVIAVRGIEPLYISCKTSSPEMKYIDEIYPQAMRMSGGEGHAVFACTHTIDKEMPIYNKAKALGVYIIDGEDIKNGLVIERLRQMAEKRYIWKDEPGYQELINRSALTVRIE